MADAAPDPERWAAGPNPCDLTHLEVGSGVVLGLDRSGFDESRGPWPHPAPKPRTALEDVARRLLTRSPCVVAFSGGRDSSAVLAVLCAVARREGLAEPVAATARFDDDPSSDESDWQEQVVRALGVRDWEIIRPAEDFDLLGPEAVTALGRHGLLWPPPSYALLPMMRRAAGGVLVTGEGGDEAFALWPYARAWAAVSGRNRPRPRDVAALAVGASPRVVRRAVWRRREPPYQDWLRDPARRRYARALSAELADDPLRWDRYLQTMRRRRSVTLGLATMARLAGGVGAEFAAPLHDEAFLAGLAVEGGRRGLGGRTAVMTRLFGDLLPTSFLSRTTKATFGGVFWGPASRGFAEGWDGEGVDPSIVDVGRLRRAWLSSTPLYGAALPLHAAWLASHSR